jgi:hypothetical protein
MVTKDAALVAGPVIRNTKAAPGVMPFIISAAAIGTEAVAQTYIGIPKSIITSIGKMPVPSLSAKKPSGTRAEIKAATTKPSSIALPISRGSEYSHNRISFVPTGTTFVLATLILLCVIFERITKQVDHNTADYAGNKRRYRSEYGEDRAKQRISNKNAVNARLRGREQKRNGRPPACTVLTE